ncbi:MAG: YeaC family protein [Nitrincola sp.]|nr:YeaC family protein [Nitrincola sp.]
MTFDDMIDAMTVEIYESMKHSIEIGKWPNGTKLTPEQREQSLRAIIAYEHKRNIPENERVGFIDRTRPDGKQHGSDPLQPDVLKILNS